MKTIALLLSMAVVLIGLLAHARADESSAVKSIAQVELQNHSPVDLLLTNDQKHLLVVNQHSNSLALVQLADDKVVSEVPAGKQPSALCLTPDGTRVLVTSSISGELTIYRLDGETLEKSTELMLGDEPRGIAVSPDGVLAYVALAAGKAVAVIQLADCTLVDKIEVGNWPRYLALTPDGSRLAVGLSGDGAIAVVDTAKRSVLWQTTFLSLNIGHMQFDRSGEQVYFPWMYYADRPISAGNIREGWVLGNRLGRLNVAGDEVRREAIALDPRGKGAADPHGVAITPDEQWICVTAAGSAELLIFKLPGMPLRADGPGDHMDPSVATGRDTLYRVPLGGRPLAVRIDGAGKFAYVANFGVNAVQVVDLADHRVARTIALGSSAEPSLARRGELIFYDGARSVDKWYSCHSCHYDGDTNAVTMDTNNDGTYGTYKTVLSLRNVTHTGPWFWHGWQADLKTALHKSMIDTMQGPEPSKEDVDALAAFLETLEQPVSAPHAETTAAVERGRALFNSETAACASCHSGKYFTDGEIHDVGLGSSYDLYKGYNTPSLLGVKRKARLLHHGKARTLEDLLTGLHSPTKVSDTRDLEPQEVADLAEYLRSL
jgi:DNA-binding beta-propeller fold protein YncE